MPFGLSIAVLSHRLGVIIAGLCGVLAAAAARDRAMAPQGVLLWRRLKRLLARFQSLVARGGVTRPTRPRASRPGGERTPAHRWPSGFASLVRLVPGAAAYGSQLQALLGEPEMQTLLAEAPQAARILRPLCQMLGVRPGPLLPPTPARPKTADPGSAVATQAASQPDASVRSADPSIWVGPASAGATPPLPLPTG